MAVALAGQHADNLRTSQQTNNHANISGQMLFLMPTQHYQSSKGKPPVELQ